MRLRNIAISTLCALCLGLGGQGSKAAEVPFVSIEELMAHPERYDGQVIRTVAFFLDEYGGFRVDPRPLKLMQKWTIPRRHGDIHMYGMIWYNGFNEQAAEDGQIEITNFSWVVVEGKFESGPTGDWGVYRGLLNNITFMKDLLPSPSSVPGSLTTKRTHQRLRPKIEEATYILPDTPMRFLLYPKAKPVVQK